MKCYEIHKFYTVHIHIIKQQAHCVGDHLYVLVFYCFSTFLTFAVKCLLEGCVLKNVQTAYFCL